MWGFTFVEDNNKCIFVLMMLKSRTLKGKPTRKTDGTYNDKLQVKEKDNLC